MTESPTSGPAYQKPPFRRHATADFTEADDDDEESQEEEGLNMFREHGDMVDDEDNMRRSLPVLPLFSASYLGMLMFTPHPADAPFSTNDRLDRLPAHLQHHACHPHHRPDPNRDHPHMGPATIPPSLPVPGEADAAAD
jgi:hypothetical protein